MKGKMKKTSKYLVSVVLVVVALISIYAIATTISKALAEDTKVEINAKLDKYINYEITENEKGTLVQYNVGTGVLSDNSEKGEVENNEITIELNKINQKFPNKVVVLSKEANVKEDYSYTYDNQSGKVVINTKKINDFDVICDYDTFTNEKEERDVSIKLSAKVKVDKIEKEISSEGKLEEKVTENRGDLTSVSHKTEDIYNGKIKSNIINGTEYDTEYKEELQILISKKEAQGRLQITENDSYIEEPENDLGNNNELVIKSTKINKDNVKEILGEEGIIQVLDENNVVIGEVNKETTFDENGTYEIKYENEIKQIKIRTSEVKAEGILKIENTKQIKNTMKNINVNIKTTDEVKAIEPDIVVENETITENLNEKYTYESTKITEIKDTKSDVKIEIDNNKWTSEKQNEVIFTVKLDSSSVDKNLFKTPTVRIELPEDVSKVVIGNASLQYGNGLNLKEVKEINENGRIVIVAEIEGEQKQNTENAFDLITEIKIPATVILKQGIESRKEENVTLKYTNNYTVNGVAEEGTIETKIVEYDSNNSLNEINNNKNVETRVEENNTEEDVQGKTRISVEAKRGNEELTKNSVVYEGEFIKYTVTVTNPTNERMDNVKVVATIPEGLTYAEYVTNYAKELEESKYIYNESVREKEFTIGTLNAGESKNVEYEVRVNDLVENETEKTINTVIEVSINNEKDTRTSTSNVINKAEYKVYLSALRERTLNSYSYKVLVSSNRDEEVNVDLKLPNGILPKFYIVIPTEEEANIDFEKSRNDIGNNGNDPDNVNEYFANESNIYEKTNITDDMINNNELALKLKTNTEYGIYIDIDENELAKLNNNKIDLTAIATVNGKYKSNENIIPYSKENVTISMSSPTEGEEVSYGDEIEYKMHLKMDSKLLQDKDEEAYAVINLKDYLPQELEPVSITYPKNTAQTDESNEELRGKPIFKEGEVVTETLNKTIYSDEKGNQLPNIDKEIVLPYNKDVEISVKTKAGYVYEKTKITNTAISESKNDLYVVNSESNELVKVDMPSNVKVSNIVTHTVLPYGYEESGVNEENTENNPNVINRNDDINSNSNTNTNGDGSKHTISGIVWNDSNENASRQSTEKTIENVEVMLVDAKTGNSVNTTKTNSNGTYKFSDVDSGNYLVLFRYDANKYHPTEYQKKEVNSNANSDAMQREINIEGKNTTVAVTDIIELNQDKDAIDLGLVENKIFDLKVDKYISKVTVNTVNGTKQSEYNNAKLAKAEIRAKEMQGATVVVEYKIVITNEGEIPARINKIVDYLPQGLDFSSELNSSWAKDTNGNIINTSIATKEIKPGQNVELKLIATKVMTGESTGTFTNSVELADVTNAYNIKDKDSTPANKVDGEDDLSKADLIISVSTGSAVYISTGIVLGVLAIALIIFLNMKYNIFSKIIKKKTMLVVMIGAMVLALGINSSEAAITSSLGLNYGSTLPFYVSYGYPQSGVGGTAYLSNGNFGRYVNCVQHSVIDLSLNTGWTVYRTLGSISKAGDVVRQETGNIDLSGITANESERLHVKELDANYVLGPMTITNTRDNDGYIFELLDSNGNGIDGFATCDEEGKDIAVTGTSTFYIRIPQANCANGISKVRARARRSGTKTVTENFTAYEVWYGGQAMGGYSTNHEWTETREEYLEGEVVFEWIPLGSLEIIKIDSRSTGVKLPDVEFRITSDNGFDQTVKTDKDGRIYLTDLETGVYTVKELSNPNYGYEVTDENIFNIKVLSGITNRYTLKNEKAYIDLSGMVWKDRKPDTKANTGIDGVYEEGTDELISNINDKVIAKLVYKDSGEIVKNQEGKECIAEVVDGKYKFEKIRVKELSNYNVIFTYNGFEYKDVITNLDPSLEDTSKASENTTYRKLYNQTFSMVEGTGEKTGITFGGDAQGLGGHDLEYEKDGRTSTLNKIDGGSITGRDYNYKIEMEASTSDNYIKSRYTELTKDPNKVVDEITYINLGVYERAMPDLQVEQVLHSARLTINGYEHTYFYENKDKNAGEYTGGFNVGVKFPNRFKEAYGIPVYKSDWDTFNDKNNTNKLQMYLTYAIEVNNLSTGLDAQVHSIIDYFDGRYTINKVGTTVNPTTGVISGDNIKANIDNTYNNPDGYKKAILTLSGDNIKPNNGTIVFIEFKLNDDATLAEITGDGALKNVAEINSYTIYDENGIYAGIDSNSNPANAIPGKIETYENDTAQALDVRLEAKQQERRISGKVFEDIAIEKTRNEENIIEGNGLLDDNEDGIGDVKVELVNSKTGEIVKTTTTDGNGNFTFDGFTPGEYVIKYTWGDNKYTVRDYKATIFNENDHKVQDGWWRTGNPDSDATDDYATRLKIDDGENIDKMVSTSAVMNLGIENGNEWVDKETSQTSKDYSLLYTISNADELNPSSMTISGVNFGIIRRPEIKLTTEKRVSHFKITYPNGQVLTDVDVEYDENTNTYRTSGTNNGMTYLPVDITNPYGIIRQEIDNELIQGSNMEVTYEIVVRNDSNVDYANKNFYTYGKVSGDTTNPVTITPTVVTDYLDNEFEFNQAKNQDWQVVSSYENTFDPVVTTKTEVAGDWKLAGEEKTETGALGEYKIQRYNKYLGGKITETGTTKEYSYRAQRTVESPEVQEQYKNVRVELSKDKIKELKPGERITSNLNIEKRLTNADDITFDNEVEVTEYQEKSGRISDVTNMKLDGWAERIVITPATGANRNFIIPVALGVSMLVVLGAGVLVIKKRVLDK